MYTKIRLQRLASLALQFSSPVVSKKTLSHIGPDLSQFLKFFPIARYRDPREVYGTCFKIDGQRLKHINITNYV